MTLLSTSGIDFKVKIINYHNKIIKISLTDTSGEERFRTLGTSYYRGADGILFVYDIIQRETRKKKDRQVSIEEGKTVSKSLGLECYEGSAKTGKGINDVVMELVEMIMKKKGINFELEENKDDTTINLGESVFGKEKTNDIAIDKETYE